jgi:hypothetical protein
MENVSINIDGIVSRIIKETTKKIQMALKERCKELGLEINGEMGKRITATCNSLNPNHQFYWLDYGKKNQLFLMESDIVNDSDFSKNIFAAPYLKISYELQS